jgi:two-component system phosphate regulon sensor histidine kinase PhoR
MKDVSAGRLALIISFIIGAVSFVLLSAVSGAGLAILLTSALVIAASTFFTCWFLLGSFIFGRLKMLNEEIMSSIRNDKVRQKASSRSSNELHKLEYTVKRLIREKTIEIDNLKELERIRKEFLGDVAHELRTPIFNVQGYIYTLLEGAMKDEEVSQRFLEKAARHLDHLGSLVEDLVTISRIEAGEMQLELTDFDIKELVLEVIELQDLPAKQKNIQLTIKTPEKPLMVRADRLKIRQVLNNLVNNSIKYGKQDGQTNIILQPDGIHVRVEVADNGEGIGKEHLPRIFERFYRVDKNRSRTHSSTGLGLAIVKHFIEAHRQKIMVTSREGVGSIFSFTLGKSIGDD